tara:strand:- start:3 stop:533 length:531 start_codon:yes stop_codon:yes gene_type:complete
MPVFTVIDHTEIGTGGVAYWEETGISASYDHLLIKASLRMEGAHYANSNYIVLNADGAANYSGTALYADSSISANSAQRTGDGQTQWMWSTGASATADTFSVNTVWIPNYANTANFKQVLISSGAPNPSVTNNQWIIGQAAWLYSDTAAIDGIRITPAGGDMAEFSTITLYGITGA